MELTLLELNLEEPSFSANAPFAGRESDDPTDVEVAESDESGGPSPAGFVLGLVFLVGVGLAVRRFMRSDSEEIEAEGEPVTA